MMCSKGPDNKFYFSEEFTATPAKLKQRLSDLATGKKVHSSIV
jgi:hypothetical protein